MCGRVEQSQEMPKEAVCFSTWCLNPIHDKNQMIRSLKYFHPNIPINVLTDEDKIKELHRNRESYGIFALIGKELSRKYHRVIHLDCDIIITGSLEELIHSDKLISVRNNNDYGLSGGNGAIVLEGGTVDEYVNAGTHAISGQEIWDKWENKGESVNFNCMYGEQGTLNAIFKECGGVIIDPKESNHYYGLATSWITEGTTPYSSWKSIDLNDKGELILNGKKIHILHRAGGGLPNGCDFKFLPQMFKRNVWERLMEITA